MEMYKPGVCNIGQEEIFIRSATGWTGTIVALLLIAILGTLGIPQIARIAIVIPATFAALGFIQSYMHFCAKFGLKGLFNVTGPTESVAQQEYRKKDTRKAIQIILYSIIIGILITAIAVLL